MDVRLFSSLAVDLFSYLTSYHNSAALYVGQRGCEKTRKKVIGLATLVTREL